MLRERVFAQQIAWVEAEDFPQPLPLSVVTETPGKRPGSLETIADGKTAAQGLLA